MDEIRRKISEKYEQGVEQLISKYMGLDEDEELDIVNIFDSSGFDEELELEEISFIRNVRGTDRLINSKVYLFKDVYKMLCEECDFNDIYTFLN